MHYKSYTNAIIGILSINQVVNKNCKLSQMLKYLKSANNIKINQDLLQYYSSMKLNI